MLDTDRIVNLTVASIMLEAPMTICYTSAHGMVSIRSITPYAIERCKGTGNTIVRAYDHHRKMPRSFTLTGISDADPIGLSVTTEGIR